MMAEFIDANTLKSWISDDEELALLDVREAGQFGEDHMLYSIPCPYSIFEMRVQFLVPRPSVRVVLVDADDGTAQKAARRLAELEYSDISILRGGNTAWAAAGFEVFQGVNVPSKAFGEVVEHVANTPRITAEELNAMMEAGEDMVIVDGRTPSEHHRMSIPGGISMPNAEMIYRIHDLAPNPKTTIVVNCAGRTRSIIGAQALINAGLPNRVVALKAGTMGWTLAGFQLDHGTGLAYPKKISSDGVTKAAGYAADVIKKFDLSTIDRDTMSAWQCDETRTLFLLDVRADDEFLEGHLPGSVHAPGGQLVQATDEWCGVWGARVVLIDTFPCARAAITAHWLKQMGWDVHILKGGIDRSEALKKGPTIPSDGGLPDLDTVEPIELSNAIAAGTVLVVDVDHSMDFRDAHLPSAVWCARSRIDRLEVPDDVMVVLYSQHETRARLAAKDMSEEAGGPVAILGGGREAWNAEGFPVEGSPDLPVDADCIDYLFWVSRRHMGSDEAALAYLEWEENLPAQIEADGDARFSVLTR
ncbi:MAG: rhodanese-like domain-containing protein [Pseudomonadota bacterium]|nr:rhodanese-like domain-containing protein [Pseudomonadota bacterium]